MLIFVVDINSISFRGDFVNEKLVLLKICFHCAKIKMYPNTPKKTKKGYKKDTSAC